MADKIKKPSAGEVARIGQISMTIRQALRAALPAPAEQFFTMMVPGKVVNFDDFTPGLDHNGKATTILKPRSVQLAEAILCDDMPALSAVQLGPTGKSVSRAYGATLSKLCPAGSTTGIDDDSASDGKSAAPNLTEQAKRYKKAMDWLTSADPSSPGIKRVELYREKQRQYTEAFEKKVKAFNDALDLANKDPRNKTLEEQRQAYDKWVSENHKTYRNMCQAAYMDWVTVGKKEETEYWFSVVDNDSAMSRVEASKEAMRNAIISDTDGSAEYQTVRLDPSNWAWLAKQKAGSAPTEGIRYSISRLKKINTIIKAMIESSTASDAKPADAASTGDPKTTQGNTDDSSDKAVRYIDALKRCQEAEKKVADSKDEAEKAKLKENLTAAQEGLKDAKGALTQRLAAIDEANVKKSSDKAEAATKTILSARVEDLKFQYSANLDSITELERQLKGLQVGESRAIQEAIAEDAKLGPAASVGDNSGADYWTTINARIANSSSSSSEHSSSNSASASASVSFGLWSVGGSASHSDSSSDASKEMASNEVNISFECMRVDISRSWLRPELFYDLDLKTAPGSANFISPGPITLASLLDPDTYEMPPEIQHLAADKEAYLANFSLFPMFPTSFLLASNVVLEFKGETSKIQAHFSESSTSGSLSVGYGPFSVSGSGAHTDKKVDSSCEATSEGCRITIKSPQIIGWISQMIPALPRSFQQ